MTTLPRTDSTPTRPDPPPSEPRARPARVLYVIGNLKMGGTEAHLVQLMAGLDRHRFEPRLLMLENAADLLTPELHAELQPAALEIGPSVRGTLEAATRMRRAIRRIGPDIVQAYGYPADVLTAACAAGLRGVRVVTTRRGNEVRPRRHLYYRLSNKVVDLVACVSQAAARHSRETEGLPPEKTVVIPNGIDLSRYLPPERPAAPIRSIGTVQRLRHVKGIDLILEAHARLGAGAPTLRVAGPADTAYGEEIVAQYGGRPGVEFLGEVTDIAAFLRDIDLFVLPSRSEGMSNALLEAMAMGLPIVATDVGGNAECLGSDPAGVLVEPTAESLAAGIASLVAAPRRAAEYGRRARARVEAEYDRRVMVRRYEELYERLLLERRGIRPIAFTRSDRPALVARGARGAPPGT